MSEKLISADKLIMTLESMRGSRTHATIDNIIYNLKIAPAVDAVEVVRCYQCKHLKKLNEHKIFGMCKKTKIVFWSFETDISTHFCAFGERREANAVD